MQVRNINDKVVPQRVQVDLRDDPLPHREHVSSRHRSSSPRGRRLSHDHARSPRARSRSAHPRSRSARSRSRSQHARSHAPCPRSRSPRVPARRATRSCSPQAASPSAGRSPRARSPSPVAGAKRQRSTSVGELRTAQSQRTGTGGRVKASEYDDTTQELLKQAISNFRVLISAENAFPDHDTEVEFVGRAWNGACHTLKLSMELTPNIAKLIANRGSHLRGELKTKIKPLIEITYGFNNGQNKKSIARNRVLAEELKDGCTFAFKVRILHTSSFSLRALTTNQDIKERKGMYKNTILQTAVNAMWFANRRDEGAMYPEYFDPFPLQAFGLTLAVIENLIDQYATGIRTETPFTANDYRGVYEAHCKALLEFQEHTEPYPILHGILSRMHNLGRCVIHICGNFVFDALRQLPLGRPTPLHLRRLSSE
ncbi:hypothetical protein C8J57DRAFT_1090518 [Mycena rebaudengoi]|nr:hypothetical protein C8J57DRAFT_1090518 [Mycena rebaudengoi]